MSAPQQTDMSAVMFVFIATIALAFKGIFAKFAYQAGMSVDALLLLRFGIAAPLFWVGVFMLSRHSAPLNWAQWKACIFAGGAFFLATYCDFTAISLVGVSISRLVLFTFPIMVMLINAAFFGKIPTLQQWIIFILTYIGIALVMLPNGANDTLPVDWVGVLWALGSATTYAVYLVSSQEIMKTLGSMRFTAASGSVTLVFMLVITPLHTDITQLAFPENGLWWGAAIAIFCTVIPFFMLFEGIKRCGATQASLITLSGPVLTVVAAWILLDEHLSALQMVGAGITIGGVALLKSGTVLQKIRHRFTQKKAL